MDSQIAIVYLVNLSVSLCATGQCIEVFLSIKLHLQAWWMIEIDNVQLAKDVPEKDNVISYPRSRCD